MGAGHDQHIAELLIFQLSAQGSITVVSLISGAPPAGTPGGYGSSNGSQPATR